MCTWFESLGDRLCDRQCGGIWWTEKNEGSVQGRVWLLVNQGILKKSMKSTVNEE